jgi:hypothetical protein
VSRLMTTSISACVIAPIGRMQCWGDDFLTVSWGLRPHSSRRRPSRVQHHMRQPRPRASRCWARPRATAYAEGSARAGRVGDVVSASVSFSRRQSLSRSE